MLSASPPRHIEGDALNLRLLPVRFSPTSGPVGTMRYLELIFLRFQGLIWHIWGFWILLGSGDIRQNVKVPIFGNYLFCKKKSQKSTFLLEMVSKLVSMLGKVKILVPDLKPAKKKPFLVIFGQFGQFWPFLEMAKSRCHRHNVSIKILSLKCLKNWNRRSMMPIKMD